MMKLTRRRLLQSGPAIQPRLTWILMMKKLKMMHWTMQNLVPMFANTVSYQRRQALVTYFQHNRAGITVYGFTLDRSWIHTILAVQLTLTLWILNKTIGIS